MRTLVVVYCVALLIACTQAFQLVYTCKPLERQRQQPFRHRPLLSSSSNKNKDNGERKPALWKSIQQRRKVVAAASLAVILCVVTNPANAVIARLTTTTITASARQVPKAVVTTANPLLIKTLPHQLGARHLLTAAVLVIVSSTLSLPGLSRTVLRACLRCTLQLYIAGGFLLSRLLSANQAWIVISWVIATGFLAGSEATARIEYTYPKLRRHLVYSMLTGGLTVLTFTVLTKILGPVQPWYSPRTWIPISGMLYGNTLTAAILAASTMIKELVVNRDQVEWRLCRGATWTEALQPVRMAAASKALTPAVNMLSVAGIIHMPGMLTGQILAGQSAYQAAAYQVLIFFLIASTTCITVQMLIRLVTHQLVDIVNDKLFLDLVKPVKTQSNKRFPTIRRLAPGYFKNKTDAKTLTPLNNITNSDQQHVILPWHTSDYLPLLVARRMPVDRTNMCVTFDLHRGDRLGIQGASGRGKSQILRTLAGLEQLKRDTVTIDGKSAASMKMPEWRQRVAFIQQDRPTLQGTPREWYNQVLSYNNRKFETTSIREPADISKPWGLSAIIFDQPWSTLSGGEAQRVSLAIALALEPDVLLMDESTSALDAKSTLAVEESLRKLKIPIIMVSHSTAQVDRFCNHVIDLGSSIITTRV